MFNNLDLLQWLHKEGLIELAPINEDGDVIAISNSRTQEEKDNG